MLRVLPKLALGVILFALLLIGENVSIVISWAFYMEGQMLKSTLTIDLPSEVASLV